MKFKFRRNDFLTGLNNAASVATDSTINPIISYVCMRCNGGMVDLNATDLNVWSKTSLEGGDGVSVERDGGMLVNAKMFYSMIRSLPSDVDDACIEQVDGEMKIKINAGRVRFELLGLGADDFPQMPESQNLEFIDIEKSSLLGVLGMTFDTLYGSEERVEINSVFLETEEIDGTNFLRAVSTDGHRLSKVELPVGDGFSLEKPVLIPRRGVQEILDFLKRTDCDIVDIAFNESNFYLRIGNAMIVVRLNHGSFPPYKEVIPQDAEHEFMADRKKLLGAIKRVSLMCAGEKGSIGHGIRINVSKDGILRVSVQNSDIGNAYEDIDVDGHDVEYEAVFNSQYLIDMLGTVEDEHVLCVHSSEELDPFTILDADKSYYLGVVMPLRK